MKRNDFQAYEHGQKVALIEKSLIHGHDLMPFIVQCIQSNYSLFDFGLFFEGYNKEKERE